MIITLVFEKNANFVPKIVEKCDHNIDPRIFGAVFVILHVGDLQSAE
jgi:hypothetical protein